MSRFVMRLLIAVALGIVTTIAVSWVIALREPLTMDRSGCDIHRAHGSLQKPGTRRHLEVTVRSTNVATMIHSRAWMNILPPQGHELKPRELPTWSRLQTLASGSSASRTEYASGWPCLALKYTGSSQWSALGAGDAWPRPTWLGLVGDGQWLPVTPLWTGFFVNSSGASVIFFLLLSGIHSSLKASRAHGGCCFACGYDLRGLEATAGCSECGWGRAGVT